MNKKILIEALEVLRTRVEYSIDANDADFSYFFQNKLSEIDQAIDELDLQTKYDN